MSENVSRFKSRNGCPYAHERLSLGVNNRKIVALIKPFSSRYSQHPNVISIDTHS